MQNVLLAALLKVELPGHTACLIDGGTLTWNGDSYAPRDAVLGVAEGFESLIEGVGDEAPAGAIAFLLPDSTASASVNGSGIVDSRVRLWVAEVDADAGTVIGAPDSVADWLVDFPSLSIENGVRRLTLNCVSHAQRLFDLELGNVLGPKFHERIYPGEWGLRNAVGASISIPWGAASGPRGTTNDYGYSVPERQVISAWE
ncbi:hypothetical protein [Sphingomonas sp. R1]|uniref:hypothetical protein n=1 Tax=Sphingomonas sp. R1 TaxID=399176 RepID=UPI00222514FF|nr:hypothetical protein [Sphingomonas sp. R1]UYY77799.1 hypothetical protein OIM94_01975 [Sphingomonas sp. R1]